MAASTAYDDALAELYQASLTQFIAERKRLADELKAKGDAAAAKQLAARAKPPVSAWVVNQLWWHARDAFDDLMASAEKLRKGQLAASGEHRDAIARLRKRAATILEDAGHNANEATLRRVTTTLSAIAAVGNWEPDSPGALATDKDPPGFEAVGIPAEPIHVAPAKKHDGHAKHGNKDSTQDELEALRQARRDAEQAEKKRAEEEKKRIAQEKHRLETVLRTAKVELHEREREVKALEKELRAATDKVERAQEHVDELEKALAELRDQ